MNYFRKFDKLNLLLPMTLTTADSTRISNIVELLFKERELLRDRLDKAKATQLIFDLFGEFASEELQAIADDDLANRIKKFWLLKLYLEH